MKAEVVGEISLNLLKEDGGWRGQEGQLREVLKAGKKNQPSTKCCSCRLIVTTQLRTSY